MEKNNFFEVIPNYENFFIKNAKAANSRGEAQHSDGISTYMIETIFRRRSSYQRGFEKIGVCGS